MDDDAIGCAPDEEGVEDQSAPFDDAAYDLEADAEGPADEWDEEDEGVHGIFEQQTDESDDSADTFESQPDPSDDQPLEPDNEPVSVGPVEMDTPLERNDRDEEILVGLDARVRRARRFVAGLSLALAVFCVAVMGYRSGATADGPTPHPAAARSERAEPPREPDPEARATPETAEEKEPPKDVGQATLDSTPPTTSQKKPTPPVTPAARPRAKPHKMRRPPPRRPVKRRAPPDFTASGI